MFRSWKKTFLLSGLSLQSWCHIWAAWDFFKLDKNLWSPFSSLVLNTWKCGEGEQQVWEVCLEEFPRGPVALNGWALPARPPQSVALASLPWQLSCPSNRSYNCVCYRTHANALMIVSWLIVPFWAACCLPLLWILILSDFKVDLGFLTYTFILGTCLNMFWVECSRQ